MLRKLSQSFIATASGRKYIKISILLCMGCLASAVLIFSGCGKRESGQSEEGSNNGSIQSVANKEITKFGANFWKKPLTVEAIRTAITAGADVNMRLDGEHPGHTPLMKMAMYNSDPEIISELIKLGADINARGPDLETALMLAFQYNANPSVIERLLQEGAKLSDRSIIGGQAVYALNNKNLEIVKLYIEKTPARLGEILLVAVEVNALPETISFLLDRSSVEKRTINYTPILKIALKNKCDTPNLLKIIELLSQSGGGDIRNEADCLTYAILETIDPAVISALLNVYKSHYDRTEAAGYAFKYFLPDMLHIVAKSSPEIIGQFIDWGLPAGLRDSSGTTLLMMASKYNTNPEVIELLIKAGADIADRDKEGNCAAVFARENPNVRNSKIFWTLCNKSNY